jgi:hypothetical protein
MKLGYLSKAALIVIAALLATHVFHEFSSPRAAYAQSSGSPYPVYIEPGVTMLRAPDGSRQVLGKVVVDLTNGNVWGFPTSTPSPYPVDTTFTVTTRDIEAPVSTPIFLGKFDFSKMIKN